MIFVSKENANASAPDKRPPGGPATTSPFARRMGARALVPGWPQYRWGQRERGQMLLGSFLAAIATGLSAWGTRYGWFCLAFAFLVHSASIVDAIRQGSYPVSPRWTALAMVPAALAVCGYAPALSALAGAASPHFASDQARSGYLVNHWAYRDGAPRRNDWVWLRSPARGLTQAARVVAVAGQDVAWMDGEWRVRGRETRPASRRTIARGPAPARRFRVPDGQVLVEPEALVPTAERALRLVSRDQIVGRAWARYYPVWERRLL